MTGMEVLLGRRSVRNYRADAVEDKVLEQVIDAGLYAANGGGHQIPRFIVLNGRDKVRHFVGTIQAELARFDETIYTYEKGAILNCRNNPDYDCSYGAPVMILAVAPHSHGNSMADCCCSVQNMMNAAYALGLGSCYMNLPHWTTRTRPVREALYSWGMKTEEDVFAGLVIGYSDNMNVKAAPRKENRVVIV